MSAEEAAEAYEIADKDRAILHSLYIRSDVQDGYYFRRNGREMVTMKSPSYRGSDEKLLEDIRKKYIDHRRKLPVRMTAVFRVGQPAELAMQWEGIQARRIGGLVEQAQRQPVTEDNIRKQLTRLGHSAFCVDEISISADENVFYSLKQLNELRRMAVAGLEEQILVMRGYGRRKGLGPGEKVAAEPVRADGNAGKGTDWVISICTKRQLETVLQWLAASGCSGKQKGIRIYVDGDLIVQEEGAVNSLCHKLPAGCVLYAVLPYIIRESDRNYLEALYDKVRKSSIFHGFLARSMDGLGFVRQKGNTLPCRVDAGVYVWNTSAGQDISALAEGYCLPYELRASEQRSLLHALGLPCEKIVYSRIPMMITANCLYQTMGMCGRREEYGILKDRYRMEFPVKVNCLHCMNVIYNSVPFSLYSEISKWKGGVDLRMDFTLESAEETEQVLDAFIGGAPLPRWKHKATTGHEKRVVE